jgi:uncharacterized membrane protein YfcA
MSLTVELLSGVGVGLASGLSSGLLGISPGGGLVIFSVLLLGTDQHVAQGTSLVAQAPPTGLAGIRRYWSNGNRAPARWIAWLAVGFLIGAIVGSFTAAGVSAAVLQWAYVFYLSALNLMLILRSDRGDAHRAESDAPPALRRHALILIGSAAGFSSGFMGIGGGLAITVGLVAMMKVPQHQAQMVSLVFSLIPMTVPAAWVYWHNGWLVGWPAIIAILSGLWLGADLGARLANGVEKSTLRRILIAFVFLMTLYMAFKAIG